MEMVNTFCLRAYMSSNSNMDRHQNRNRAEDASICFRKINATIKVFDFMADRLDPALYRRSVFVTVVLTHPARATQILQACGD